MIVAGRGRGKKMAKRRKDAKRELIEWWIRFFLFLHIFNFLFLQTSQRFAGNTSVRQSYVKERGYRLISCMFST
jgi:putative exporter of polyketide antibiotics